MTGASEFWEETRRRRNHFYLTWVGWLVVGFPLLFIYSWILPTDNPQIPMLAALGTWGIFWWWVGHRLTQLKCFNCGEQAFTHPYFFMKHAKCRNCGVRYRDT
jgi:hypothetical protein